MLIRSVFFIVCLITLSACSAVKIQEPLPDDGTGYQVGYAEVLGRTSNIIQHVNTSGTILYQQTKGGGGVAVGLLAGPIGTAANAALINKQTKKDVAIIKDKLSVDPITLFTEAAQASGVPLNVPLARLSLSPYMRFAKSKDNSISLVSGVFVEDTQSKRRLPNSYELQVPQRFSLQEIAMLDEQEQAKLADRLKTSYASILNRIVSDRQADLDSEEKFEFRTNALQFNESFKFSSKLIERTDDITWVRLPSGVLGIFNEFVKVDP